MKLVTCLPAKSGVKLLKELAGLDCYEASYVLAGQGWYEAIKGANSPKKDCHEASHVLAGEAG